MERASENLLCGRSGAHGRLEDARLPQRGESGQRKARASPTRQGRGSDEAYDNFGAEIRDEGLAAARARSR